jgi:hypothetical protein
LRWLVDLVALLARYYTDFYGEQSKEFATYCEPVLSFLGSDPSDEDLMCRAEDGTEESFCLLDDWFRLATLNGQEIRVNESMVVLRKTRCTPDGYSVVII